MLMRTFSTTLLKIFCKTISIIDPDDNFKRNSLALTLKAANTIWPDDLVNILPTEAFSEKTVEGEMLIRGKVSTLLQIVCELKLYTQVIFKSMSVADDTFQGTCECEWVNLKGNR